MPEYRFSVYGCKRDNPSMRVGLVALRIVLLLVALSGAGTRAQPARVTPDPQALATEALGKLPGTAAAGTLVGDKVRIAVQGASLKGAEPLFEIGSVSKVFTGLLLAQAVEAKELSLDDTLGSLLGKSVAFGSRRTAAITLRQLVTHTACLPFMPESPNVVPAESQLTSYSRAQLWNALGWVAMPKAAPCEAQYSNFGMAVLAELMAQRAGRPWAELVRTRITAPLGMRDTFVQVPAGQASRLVSGYVRDVPARHWAMDAFAGTGGLRSTVTDLLIFSKALLKGRQGPLGAAAERLVTDLAPYAKGDVGKGGSGKGSEGGRARIGYAVFFPVAPTRVWAHSGRTGGQVAEWIVWPERQEAVVILVSNMASPARGMGRALIAR